MRLMPNNIFYQIIILLKCYEIKTLVNATVFQEFRVLPVSSLDFQVCCIGLELIRKQTQIQNANKTNNKQILAIFKNWTI